jgi:1-acyl-sn-glycerol-3-phosphate acyltransferase
MIATEAEVRTLTDALIRELTKAFALPQLPHIHNLIRIVFGNAAHAAARVGIGLDQAVAEGGLPAGARWILPRFVKSHEARGVDRIPSKGPLVIAANHPASVDSIVISAHINRPDYKIIIGDIPFFQHLPHVNANAIFAPDQSNPMGRMQVIRESIRHLRDGGALLIFPRGGIEADPAFMPHPEGEFSHWSRSLEVFLQHVPGLQILITIVSGVIFPRAIRHPITWLRKARPDRQRLAFLHQLARQMLAGREIFGLMPRVTYGEVISGAGHGSFLEEIERAARRTLDQHMAWDHV